MTKPLQIGAREVVTPAIVFVVIILGFAGLGVASGWPNAKAGWPQALLVAAGFAALPLLVQILNFLRDSRASIEGLGVKLNFAAAVRAGTAEASALAIGEVRQGLNMPESNSRALETATAQLAAEAIVVLDLEDGRAWYTTRLFAVAAAAQLLGSPRLLVVVGRRGSRPRQPGGVIAPERLTDAVIAHDKRYAAPWALAQRYVAALRALPAGAPPGQLPASAPPDLPMLTHYSYGWSNDGDSIVMRIVIDALRDAATGLEPVDFPPWLTLVDFERIADAWLVRDTIDLAAPTRAKLAALFRASQSHVLATEDGSFKGVIDVRQAEREVLRQLAERSLE